MGIINIYTDGAAKGNPGPGGYMFKINTGITFDIDQLTTTSMF